MVKKNQLSFDDDAAELAATMNFPGAGAPLRKGAAAGDMPMGQGSAEGGFTEDAGGQVITAGVEGAVSKAGITGARMSGEPGPQNQAPKVGAEMNSEPGHQDGGGAGSGGNLSQDGDAPMRARKPGQIGVSGGSTGGGNLSETEDETMRGRKAGKVGISKAEAEAIGLSKAQFDMLAEKGLIKGLQKSDDEDADDEDEEEEDEDKAAKSVAPADLMKALHTLEAVAAGSAIPTSVDRRVELAKGLETGALTTAEMVELADLMKAGAGVSEDEPGDPLIKADVDALEDLDRSFQQQFAEAEAPEGTYDVAPFLERLHQQTAGALDSIQKSLTTVIRDQGVGQRNFNVALSKSLQGMAQLAVGQGELIKSLSARLETVENTPLPRRGVTTQHQVLRKSLSDEAGVPDTMTRPQILDVLEAMSMKMDAAPCGERLDRAVALFETQGQMTKSLYNDVVRFAQSNNSNNGMVNVH